MSAIERPPAIDDSACVSIAEAASLTGVSVETLRYYEKIDLLPPIRRTDGGQRAYSPDDLGWISFIRRLRATGMPVREIGEYTAMVRAGDGTVADRRRFLERHRSTVQAAISELHDALAALDHKIAHYEAVESGDEVDCADTPLENTQRLG